MKLYIIGTLKKDKYFESLSVEKFLSLLAEKQFEENDQKYFKVFKSEKDAEKYLEFSNDYKDQKELKHYIFTIEGDDYVELIPQKQTTEEVHNIIDTETNWSKLSVSALQFILSKGLSTFNERKEIWEKKLADKKSEIINIENAIKKYDDRIKQLKEQRNQVQKPIAKIQQAIEIKQEELLILRQKAFNIPFYLDASKSDLLCQLSDTNLNKDTILNEIDKYSDYQLQTIDTQKNVKKEIEKITEDIKAMQKEMMQISQNDVSKNISKIIKLMNKKLADLHTQKDIAEAFKNQIENRINLLNAKINVLQNHFDKEEKQKLIAFTKFVNQKTKQEQLKAAQEELLINYFDSCLNNSNNNERPKLFNQVCKEIPAKDFQGLVYSAYDKLNAKHGFDLHNNTEDKEGTKQKQATIANAIHDVVNKYHAEESKQAKQAKRTALFITVLGFLGIVTIPLAIKYYRNKLEEIRQSRTYHSKVVIPNGTANAAKDGIKVTLSEDVKNTVGLVSKVLSSQNIFDQKGIQAVPTKSNQALNKPANTGSFKEVLFNGNHLRKVAKNQFKGFGSVIKMIVTDGQIESRMRKEAEQKRSEVEVRDVHTTNDGPQFPR